MKNDFCIECPQVETFEQKAQRLLHLPFINQQIGAGDVIKSLTQALGIPSCTPCEERRKRLNQKLTLTPWGT